MHVSFSFFHLSVFYSAVELNGIVLKLSPHTLKCTIVTLKDIQCQVRQINSRSFTF